MTETERGEANQNWKAKVLIIGTVAGALMGLGTAYLMARSSDHRRGGPPEISTGEALRVGIAAIGLVRGIAALGD